METLLGIFIGIGLSAACGFRVFIPLMIVSVASLSGHLTLAPGFEWIGTYPALVAFGIASIIETLSYFVPVIDNLLDTISFPAAVIAGTIVMASAVSELSPLLRWSLAVIVGGGTAGTIQGLTSIARLTLTATTAGLGNPIFSTAEAGGSVAMSILAISLPFVALISAIGVMCYAFVKLYRRLFRERVV
jgi:hypothetical protein